MKYSQNAAMKWIMFAVFLVLFTLAVLGTLAMVFLGKGNPSPEERSLLVKVLIGEVALAVIALFYSLFNLKPSEQCKQKVSPEPDISPQKTDCESKENIFVNSSLYSVPSSLSSFRHGEIQNHSVSLVRQRILAVCSNTTGTIKVEYPVNTVAKNVESAISISHPDIMSPLQNDEKSKIYAVKIQAEQGRTYLVSSASNVTLSTNVRPKNPNPGDPIMDTIHDDYLDGKGREFVGSRMPNAPVAHHRTVIEFSPGSIPQMVHTLQINSNGKVIKGDYHGGYTIVRSKDMTQAILDINNPEPCSGVYMWWEWGQ